MCPSEIIERARTKTQEIGERTGKAINKGLTQGWGKAKDLRANLRKKLPHVHGRTEKNDMSKKRHTRNGDKK